MLSHPQGLLDLAQSFTIPPTVFRLKGCVETHGKAHEKIARKSSKLCDSGGNSDEHITTPSILDLRGGGGVKNVSYIFGAQFPWLSGGFPKPIPSPPNFLAGIVRNFSSECLKVPLTRIMCSPFAYTTADTPSSTSAERCLPGG